MQTEKRALYLRHTEVLDFKHPAVAKQARLLSEGCNSTVELVQKTYAYVRDEIHHSADLAAKLMSNGALTTLSDGMHANLE